MEVVQDIIAEDWCLTCMEPYIVGWKMTKKKPLWVKVLIDWQKQVQKVDRSALTLLSSSSAHKGVNEQQDINDDHSNEKYNNNDEDDIESESSTSQSNSSESDSSSSSSNNNQNSNDEKNSNDTDRNEKHSKNNQNSNDEKDLKSTDSDVEHDNVKKQKITTKFNKDVFSGNFKSKMAEKAKKKGKPSSSDPIDIYITGPFRNDKKSMSHFVVIYGGGNGGAYMVKSDFIREYISTVMDGVEESIIDPSHCDTYYDINLRMEEFGVDSKWKRNANDKTTSRISFVYSCVTKDEKKAKQGIVEAIALFFTTMEKREENPVGPIIGDYLENNAPGLYKYLMTSKNASEEEIGGLLTDDIHNHFCVGYSLKWNDNLNRCMVDYDIIRILKFYIGYSNWSDVPMKQKKLCYKDFQDDSELPIWNIQQERYT